MKKWMLHIMIGNQTYSFDKLTEKNIGAVIQEIKTPADSEWVAVEDHSFRISEIQCVGHWEEK